MKLSIPLGDILGHTTDGVYQFHAIPYCEPLTRQTRFNRPTLLTKWNEVLDARHPGTICPQNTSNLNAPMGEIDAPQDENSLTLAISTPSLDESLPVAVFFHGGAFCSGAGDLPWYDGQSLARSAHCVVVGVNYRLGAFGHLHHPSINRENLSIEDQICALEWIQAYIAHFGGDATRVTLFGQSAGANAILHILSLPKTRGLFQNIILQSPSIGRGNHTMKNADAIGCEFLKAIGLNPTDPCVREKLSEKTTQDILRAMKECTKVCGPQYQNMIFKPVKDGWQTPQECIDAIVREAKIRGTRVIEGTTADETHAFSLLRDPDNHERLRKRQITLFDQPAQQLAESLSSSGIAIWKYHFEWKAPLSPYNSCHCIELPFVFGTYSHWHGAQMLQGASDNEMQKLTQTMQTLWGQFLHKGRFDDDTWPVFQTQDKRHLIINNKDNPVRFWAPPIG